jgi:hypothetical protein
MKKKIADEVTFVRQWASDDETDFTRHCTAADFNYCYDIMKKKTEDKNWEFALKRLIELHKHYNPPK